LEPSITVKNRPIIYQVKSICREGPDTKTLRIECPSHLSKMAHPGQFLMVWIPGIDEVPMSISNIAKEEVWITVKKVGEATSAIHDVTEGGILGLRGPYGTSFSAKGRNTLIVGGGIGAAPLLFLAMKLMDSASRITMVIGGRSADKLILRGNFEELFRQKSQSRLILATDDGSESTKGYAGDIAATLLEEEEFDRVYTCGPEPMMHKVINKAQGKRIQVEASLERYMRCGIGICGSCYMGKYLICKDGPVFTGAQLAEIVQYLNTK
jgi:dihydroorotate dehydrogenase electron transfer subunit